MGEGYFDVSYELLRDVLHLPTGTVIEHLSGHRIGLAGKRFRVYVKHPAIPNSKKPLLLEPTHRHRHNVPIEFLGWYPEVTEGEKE